MPLRKPLPFPIPRGVAPVAARALAAMMALAAAVSAQTAVEGGVPEVPGAAPGSPASDSVAEDSAGVLPRHDSLPVLSEAFWKKGRFEFYDITERELTEALWRMAGRTDEPEEDHYQVLLFTDSLRYAYLLRAGTQAGRLPDSALPLLRQKIRAGSLSRGGGSDLWHNFWNPADPLQPYLWPTGLEVRAGMAGTVVRRATPQLERHYDLTFLQRPVPWIAMEIGGHLSTYGGGLQRNIYDPKDEEKNREFWGKTDAWWHAAIGIPGVKWEISLANRTFPEFFWLDPYAGEGSYKAGRRRAGDPVGPLDTAERFRDGALMREWSQDGDPVPSRGNLAQALHLKAGGLRYSAYFDPDVYRSVIHRAFFGDLPAPFGTWGFGFIAAAGSGHSLVRLDIAPVRIGLGKSVDNNYLRLLFLRVDGAYRDPKTFRIGLSTSALLDSRTFRPGDTP